MKTTIAGSALLLLAAASFAEGKKGAPTPADIESGRKVYETNCASCHGPGGAGDGVAAAALNPKPRDLTDAAYMKTRSAATLRKVVEEGGQSVGLSPLMIGWKAVLKPDQIDDVLAFISTLAGVPKK